MKRVRHYTIYFSILLTSALNGCIEPLINPNETVVFRGRIVQGYNTNLPIQGVTVAGCVTDFSLFPNSPSSCDARTSTDIDGNFYLKFEADKFQSKRIVYHKEGYLSLDSCKSLQDGSMECYMKELPTIFYIYSSVKEKIPFKYDSLVVSIKNMSKDTLVHYWTSFFINTSSDTSYYWRTANSQFGAFM